MRKYILIFILGTLIGGFSLTKSESEKKQANILFQTNASQVLEWKKYAKFVVPVGDATQREQLIVSNQTGEYITKVSPPKELCLQPYVYESVLYHGIVDNSKTNCPDSFIRAYKTSDLAWVYTIESINDLSSSIESSIVNINNKITAVEKSNYDTNKNTKKTFTDMFDNIVNLKIIDSHEFKKILNKKIEDEVQLRIAKLENDPAFILKIAKAIQKVKPK